MMMNSLFLALVAAIAVCSQQARAELIPLANSAGEKPGADGMKMSWSKNGNEIAITLEAVTTGYILYTFGAYKCPMEIVNDTTKASGKALALINSNCEKFGGSHGSGAALVCTQDLCKSTTGGEVDSPDEFGVGPTGWTCSHNKIGSTISGTCTRTITGDDDPMFPVGATRGSMASDAYNGGNSHIKLSKFDSIITGTYVPPIDPNPSVGPDLTYQLCSDWRSTELAKGRTCETGMTESSNVLGCQTMCEKYDCCKDGKQLQGTAGDTGTGTGTGTSTGTGSTTLTPGCQTLMNAYRALGQMCPNNQYRAMGNQCQQAAGDCQNWQECCQVQLVDSAGSLASPALAVVLASALAMLALLF